jgi:2'-hydroxyisoflavone reductase
LDLLVIGGGVFLGRAVVEAALRDGHRVTVFNRGRSSPAPQAGVEHLVGDRYADLAALRSCRWDAVVDTCAFTPDAVASLLDAVEGSVARYVLVSSISTYADFSQPPDEDSPTRSADGEELAMARSIKPGGRGKASSYGKAYGPLKRSCEEIAQGRLGDRAIVVRAGVLVGPGDYTDRFTYWVRRIDGGGRVACPGDPRRAVQIVDVRDAAAWMVRAADQRRSGRYNVTGAERTLSMGEMLETCRRVSGSGAELVWVPEDTLAAAGVAHWTDMPLWLPSARMDLRHFMNVSTAKAMTAGLRFRPLRETVADVLAWDGGRRHIPLQAGLSQAAEARLVHAPDQLGSEAIHQ